MCLEEAQSLLSKVFTYQWKSLIDDGYVSKNNEMAKKTLIGWFKQWYEKKGRYPRYHEVILFISGMM